MEIIITKENFDSEVLNSSLPVLVDFWASWCGPCMMLAPTIEEIADEYDGKVKVGKINVDDVPDLAIKFGVSSIPTLIYFENGKPVKTMVGVQPKESITKLFE